MYNVEILCTQMDMFLSPGLTYFNGNT